MNNRINILDDITINKIAAGEVVERPASIVKELVENSIDAGADRIIIEIEDGGKSLIKITDNGTGILSSEVSKCFLRHATSKIDKVDDLMSLYTLGFRGEALASISAVSKLEMTTKSRDEVVGTSICLEGGKVISKEAVGANNGTSMAIKDLFFNTPARKKFLKSSHSETMNISDMVNKLACGYPNIKFKYINNGRIMIDTPGDGEMLSAIRSIYGKEISTNLIHGKYSCNLFDIDGYIGNNNIYRSNRNLQHIYINGRFVKSKVIMNAIAEAYKAIVPLNKHAVCFINISLDPSKLDVNIHPGKLEVKFEKENEIYIEIRDYIRGKLLRGSLIGKYETFDKVSERNKKSTVVQEYNKGNHPDNKNSAQSETASEKMYFSENAENPNIYSNNTDIIKPFDISDTSETSSFMTFEDAENEKKHINKDLNKCTYNNEEKTHNNTVNDEISSNQSIENRGFNQTKASNFYEDNKPQNSDKNINADNVQGQFASEHIIKENESTRESYDKPVIQYGEDKKNKEKSNGFSMKEYKIVGTVFDTYIVLQKGNSMFLMDQHAAHERVMFEKYMNKFKKSSIDMQMILDPILLELSSVDMAAVEGDIDVFIKYGFDVEIFGEKHILVRGVPNMFGIPQSESFILEIIDNLGKIDKNYDLRYYDIATMACKSAIKAHDKIQMIEIEALFKQLEKCENPYTCPHGRPTMVEISQNEIEKMFKRIMN